MDRYGELVASSCESLPIKKISFFGSILTNKFSDDSDVDLLVEFVDEPSLDYFDAFFSTKEVLEKILKRSIDLTVDRDFSNQIFSKSIKKRRLVYERNN